MNRLALCFVALMLFPGAADAASQQGNATLRKWKTMDICAKQAQAAFPDYSAEANAKRDAKLQECLNANNLPPREPLSQPQPR